MDWSQSRVKIKLGDARGKSKLFIWYVIAFHTFQVANPSALIRIQTVKPFAYPKPFQTKPLVMYRFLLSLKTGPK